MKCTRTDEGLRFWNGNELIAMTDEFDVLFSFVNTNDEPVTLGNAYSEREAREILARHGIS